MWPWYVIVYNKVSLFLWPVVIMDVQLQRTGWQNYFKHHLPIHNSCLNSRWGTKTWSRKKIFIYLYILYTHKYIQYIMLNKEYSIRHDHIYIYIYNISYICTLKFIVTTEGKALLTHIIHTRKRAHSFMYI